jgi:AcrR family transcriptional regulator
MATAISTDRAAGGTRGDFLSAARRLFAEKGFYGASIQAIADELGLTKQALLHHFGSKERLYGEVLAQLADRLSTVVGRAGAGEATPTGRLEAIFLQIFRNTQAHPDDTRLILRELLDNRHRAEQAHSWHMRGFLDALTAIARRANPAISEAEALARVYLVLGAINFFAVSEATLKGMYGQAPSAALTDQIPRELSRIVRGAFG